MQITCKILPMDPWGNKSQRLLLPDREGEMRGTVYSAKLKPNPLWKVDFLYNCSNKQRIRHFIHSAWVRDLDKSKLPQRSKLLYPRSLRWLYAGRQKNSGCETTRVNPHTQKWHKDVWFPSQVSHTSELSSIIPIDSYDSLFLWRWTCGTLFTSCNFRSTNKP